jgi:DNA anti-recombination protein RmuC
LRIQAEKKAEDYTQKIANLEDQIQQMIKSYNGQMADIKAEAAEEVAKTKADAKDTISKLKARQKQNPQPYTQVNIGTKQKTISKTILSTKTSLVEKVDKLIKDKGTIF